jgi:anti-sigma factor RsiW
MINANMQHADYQILKETSWRRPLTAEERARLRQWLASHPDCQPSWEEEEALSRLLHRLPNAAVSSNFTARVLQAAQRLPAKPAWRRRLLFFPWFPAGWIPRLALSLAMLTCGFCSFREGQAIHRAQAARVHHSQAARELARVSRLAAVPSMSWLKDFDTINKLSQVKVADDDLLSALQ